MDFSCSTKELSKLSSSNVVKESCRSSRAIERLKCEGLENKGKWTLSCVSKCYNIIAVSVEVMESHLGGLHGSLNWGTKMWHLLGCSSSSARTLNKKVADSCMWDILIRDTAYFIVIHWSIRSYFIESQWNMLYPVWKCPGNKEAREGTARFLLRHRSERSHFNIFEHCVRCYARVVHRVLGASCVVSMQRRI